MHSHGLGLYFLADSGVVIKEPVEYAAGAGLNPDIHKAGECGRVYDYVSGLLGDEHIAAEDSCIVNLALVFFPFEIYVGRGFHFLAPEALE